MQYRLVVNVLLITAFVTIVAVDGVSVGIGEGTIGGKGKREVRNKRMSYCTVCAACGSKNAGGIDIVCIDNLCPNLCKDLSIG